MRALKSLSGLALGFAIAGCATGWNEDMTVAEYCANPEVETDAVCRLKVEIDGNSTAIADTNLGLSEARNMTDRAINAARTAQATADEAKALAGAANDEMVCKTITINNSDTGTCGEGYTLMGCTQTRYTTRAGGLSFLREVSNEQCRFNSRVLEMDVRCCTEQPRSLSRGTISMDEAADAS